MAQTETVGKKKDRARAKSAQWTFLSNHAHVLICLARKPDLVLREVAAEVGITERAVQRIVRELNEAGAVRLAKAGRRNRYEIQRDLPLRHQLERGCVIGDLIEMVERVDAETRASGRSTS